MSETSRRKFKIRLVTSALLLAIVVPAYLFNDGLALKILLLLAAVIAALEFLGFLAHPKRKSSEPRRPESEIVVSSATKTSVSPEAKPRLETEVSALPGTKPRPGLPSSKRIANNSVSEKRDERRDEDSERLPVSYELLAMLAILYVVMLGVGASAPLLLRDGYSKEWLGFIILTAVATDVGAYLVGIAYGRSAVPFSPFPKISPNKSFEGLAGGYLTGLAFSYLWNEFVLEDYFLRNHAWIFLSLPLLAILGDFCESAIKRLFGVKDASEHAPRFVRPFELLLGGKNGHGGYLDRLDSLTFLLFLTAFYLRYR